MVENFCWYCSSAKAIAAGPKYICNVIFHISLAKKSAQQKIKVINWTVLQPLQSLCAWWDLEKCIRFFLRAILLWCSFGLLTKQEGHASGPKRAIIMYWKKKREMEAFHTICKQFFKRFPLGTFLHTNRNYISFMGYVQALLDWKRFVKILPKKDKSLRQSFFRWLLPLRGFRQWLAFSLSVFLQT